MMKVMKTKDYHEDYGDCLFFHFDTFEEPPEAICASPLDMEFDENYYTHFVKDFDFNDLFDQAIELNQEE